MTMGEDLMWLIGAMVCLHAAPRFQLLTWAMYGHIMRRGIISRATAVRFR